MKLEIMQAKLIHGVKNAMLFLESKGFLSQEEHTFLLCPFMEFCSHRTKDKVSHLKTLVCTSMEFLLQANSLSLSRNTEKISLGKQKDSVLP